MNEDPEPDTYEITANDLFYHQVGQFVANLAFASVTMGHEAPAYSFDYIDPDPDDPAAMLVVHMFTATRRPTMDQVREWLFDTSTGQDTIARCAETIDLSTSSR